MFFCFLSCLPLTKTRFRSHFVLALHILGSNWGQASASVAMNIWLSPSYLLQYPLFFHFTWTILRYKYRLRIPPHSFMSRSLLTSRNSAPPSCSAHQQYIIDFNWPDIFNVVWALSLFSSRPVDLSFAITDLSHVSVRGGRFLHISSFMRMLGLLKPHKGRSRHHFVSDAVPYRWNVGRLDPALNRDRTFHT